jgi:hypothetical protein
LKVATMLATQLGLPGFTSFNSNLRRRIHIWP